VRIAQVAPLYEAVPPKFYGGTERVVSYLTEELVRQGHEVTLFASGDSVTRARLVPICPRALRLDDTCRDPLARHVVMLQKVFEAAHRFDIIHFHIDYLHFPLSRRYGITQLTTLHGRLDLPDLPCVYDEFDDMPVVSISDAQRRPLPQANWQGTVHHGLPPDLYRLREAPSDYLAFVGRISREKRLDRAVEIARRVGLPLRIAAKVDMADRDYFRQEIEPLFHDPLVEYVGEIGERDKGEFLGNARALLFPIEWPEPFGLVMIESMACGTPVIAYPCGSVPEVIEEGVTGFVVSDMDTAAGTVEGLGSFDRRRCRQAFERRFTVARMASDYLRLYRRLIERHTRDRHEVRVARPPATISTSAGGR